MREEPEEGDIMLTYSISGYVYLCRDSALEGFIGRCLIGNVALWSPVMFCHLRAERYD